MKKLLALVMLAAPLYLAGCDKDNGNDPLPDADAMDDPDVILEPTPDVPTETPEDVPVEVPPDVDDDACTGLTAPNGGICNIVEQCGCMPGFACDFQVDPATCLVIESCVGGAGTVDVEGECSSAGECRPGTSCLTRSGDETGYCYEWCVDSSDCSMAGRECTVSVSFTLPSPCTGTGSVPYNACDIGCPDAAGCDLFSTDSSGTTNGCPDGEMCMKDNPIASGGCDVTTCIPEGTGAEGEECSDSASGCLSSMGCYGNETDGYYCRKYCDDTNTCATGTCTALGSEGDPDLGICI